jgi:superfamily II DNA or RNA helicase
LSRRTRPSPRSRRSGVAADSALLSTDLEAWAGERVARSGRESALLGRVVGLRLSNDGKSLEARVRDLGPSPYRVQVVSAGGLLIGNCSCPFDWGPVCKHAVAAVEALRFPRPVAGGKSKHARTPRRGGRTARGRGRIVTPAQVPSGTLLSPEVDWAPTRDERIARAREEEIQARKKRARRERARVRRLPSRGGPPSFQVAGREPGSPYVVSLRGVKGEMPSCTCADFAKNELGVCKHIERARGWYSRRRKRFPKQVLSVWWRPREWPMKPPDTLREIRLDGPPAMLTKLSDFFDSEGWLREPPPDTGGAAWARRAVAAAEGLARSCSVVWDLDPAVGSRIGEVQRGEDLRRDLSVTARGGSIWQRIVPRLGLRLHAYQEDGTRFLSVRGRAFLADDMGLGKTLQAIAAGLLMREAGVVRRVLVVCPASLKHQWRVEIARACGEQATVVDGPRSARSAAYERWHDGFLVLNYELALRDLDAILAMKVDLVILDEAQRIKNWETKTAKAIKRLESPFAFVLTGTPLENRLTELHSLTEFLHPRILGPRWRLIPAHAVTDPTGRVLAYEALDVLRRRLQDTLVRRERKEVLDQLPPRIEHTFWTGMTPAQWRPYRRQASRIAGLLASNRPLRASELRVLLQALTSMRILCNSYAQFAWDHHARRVLEGGSASRSDLRNLHSPKLEEFVRVLEDLLEQSEAKVVVFSQWERMLRLAHFATHELLLRRGERAEVFHGGLDAAARSRLLDAFSSDPDLRILFSTDSGSLGLNLQDAASVVVQLEVPWNPAVVEQRVGRVHRLGQTRSVQVLHFVTKGTIEERVRRVVEAKRALFEGLLVEEADRIELDVRGQSSFLERVRSLISEDESPAGTVPSRRGAGA